VATYFRILPVELRREIEGASKSTKGHDRIVIKPRRGKSPNMSYEIGTEAEERFFFLCAKFETNGEFPRWLLEIHRGTVGDDSNGVDAHARVVTEMGKQHRVPIQIKSSYLGKKKFREKAEWRHIACVVVAQYSTDEEIFDLLLEEVSFVWEMLCLAGQ